MTGDPPRRFSSRPAAAAAAAGRRQRLRTSSAALRSYQPELALVDVLCAHNTIARVLDRGPEMLNAVIEVHRGRGPNAGTLATIVEVKPGTTIDVDCRCGRTHSLDGSKLSAAAASERPGRPRGVTLREVLLP